jgi:hypothetical protein
MSEKGTKTEESRMQCLFMNLGKSERTRLLYFHRQVLIDASRNVTRHAAMTTVHAQQLSERILRIDE